MPLTICRCKASCKFLDRASLAILATLIVTFLPCLVFFTPVSQFDVQYHVRLNPAVISVNMNQLAASLT